MLVPLLPRSSYELTILWHAYHLSHIHPSASVALTSVDGTEEKGYEHLPPLEESVAAHLCPPTAIGWKARASYWSKPCRATSALAGHAFSAAGRAASALHSMAVLQVFQSKMLANEEAGLDSASLRDLRSVTDLALHATKTTAQAIGHSRSSLIMLERHLWLMMTEMNEADKVPFLHTPVSSGSLFGPAVEGVAERFTEAQKSSQCRHFLPKRTYSSSASSHPRPAPTQQTAKPLPSSPEPRPPEGRRDRGRSCSARRYPFPKRQGPRPKIALDSPQKSFWTSRQKEEGPKSRYRWTTLQAASIVSLATPLSSEHKGKCVHGSSWAHYSAQVSDRCDSGQIKTHTFQKERKNNFLPTIIILPLYSQSAQPFQPLCCVGLGPADLVSVSTWVMTTVSRGYTLHFARRPQRFRSVLATIVRSKDAQVL